MIEGEEDYWEATDGTRYKVGETVPVIRINGIVLFNEKIVKGYCDLCDWAIIAPACLVQAYSSSHVESHLLEELAEEFRHPDFKE
jgi:alanine-alpha-ketoisovalerate/valine-pyruvate aminotransferase